MLYTQSKPSIQSGPSSTIILKREDRIIQEEIKDELPVEDPYGGYKSNSQIFFTDNLYKMRKWSLWHTVIFVILMWNFFLFSLELSPLVVDYMEDNIRCEVPYFNHSNWTFDQIKNISHYRNATSRCYYYVRKYKDFVDCPFEVAYNIVHHSKTPKAVKCNRYVLRVPDAKYNYLDKYDLLCSPNYFKMFHFMSLGQIIGYAISGFVADIYGRRTALLAALPVALVGSIFTTIAPTYWLMYLFTTIAVASLHGTVGISMILFSEIVHYEIRYIMFASLVLGYSLGNYLEMILHYYVVTWNTRQYHLVVNLSFLVPICTLWVVPESPHWLLCHKHWQQMRDLLNEVNYPNVLRPYETHESSRPLPAISAKEIIYILLKPAFRKKLFIGVLLFALTAFVHYTETSRIIRITNSGAKSAAVDATSSMTTVMLIPLLLKFMDRPMCICCSLLVLAFFYCSTTIYNPYSGSGFVAACICLVLAQTAIFVNTLLIFETFPTRARATAFGLCKCTGTTIVLVSKLLTDYTDMKGLLDGVYGWSIYAAVILIAAFICVLVSDTGNVPLPDTELQAIVHF